MENPHVSLNGCGHFYTALNSTGDQFDTAPECARYDATVIRFGASKSHMQVVHEPSQELHGIALFEEGKLAFTCHAGEA